MAVHVTEIRFEVVVDGKRIVASFFRDEKIASLVASTDTLGGFLRALIDSRQSK